MLGANIENMKLTEIAAITGTGNELNNTLTDTSRANMLTGRVGKMCPMAGLWQVSSSGAPAMTPMWSMMSVTWSSRT